MYNLDSKLLPILTGLRRLGVRIDCDRLDMIERWALEKETEALAQVRSITGHRIAVGDVWKPEVIAPALEHIGIKLNKTSQGKPNIDKELLGSIDHPVADLLERARKVNKLRTTFASSVRDHMVNGRLHGTFNQLRRQKDDESDGTAGAAYVLFFGYMVGAPIIERGIENFLPYMSASVIFVLVFFAPQFD